MTPRAAPKCPNLHVSKCSTCHRETWSVVLQPVQGIGWRSMQEGSPYLGPRRETRARDARRCFGALLLKRGGEDAEKARAPPAHGALVKGLKKPYKYCQISMRQKLARV